MDTPQEDREARQLGQEAWECISDTPDLFREAERAFTEDYSWKALSKAQKQRCQPLREGLRYTRKSPKDKALYFRLRNAIDDILKRTTEVGGLGESWFEDQETRVRRARFVVWVAFSTLDEKSVVDGVGFYDEEWGLPRLFLLHLLSEDERDRFFTAAREALSLLADPSSR